MFSLLRVLIVMGVLYLILYVAYKLIMAYIPKKKKSLSDVDEKIDDVAEELTELEKSVIDRERDARETLDESKFVKEEINKRKNIFKHK